MIMDSLSELNMYVTILENQNNKIFTESDVKQIMEQLKIEFNINVLEEQIKDLFNPDVYGEVIDREIMMKNIFG